MGRVIGILVALAVVIGAVLGVRAALRRTVPAQPPAPTTPRLVSLSPALSIMLKDLGASSLIVGRDRYDTVTDRAIPVCGDFQDVQYETILRVRPTHLLLQRSEVPPRLAELAARNGWTVRNYASLLSLDDIQGATRDLAAIAQVPPEPLLQRMQASWSKRADGFARAGRVLLLETVDPPAALGPGSFHQQLLERIGGTPAITTGKPYITMDAEDVARLNPDVILYFNPRPPGTPPRSSPPTAAELRAVLGRIGTLDIRAVREGRIALLDDPSCLTPSSAMIGTADEMAKILGTLSGP